MELKYNDALLPPNNGVPIKRADEKDGYRKAIEEREFWRQEFARQKRDYYSLPKQEDFE